MHDLGGCRIVFPTIQGLQDFRTYLEKGSRARHILLHERTKYDYILQPKETGYRGVHYVYGYDSRSPSKADLRGLKVELQLRTATQHAWATAVETADLVLGARTKFEDGTGTYGEFFRLSSEILARSHEGVNSCLPELRADELKQRFEEQERDHALLERLATLREQGDLSKIKQHTILAFQIDNTLEIYGYTKASQAIKKESDLLLDVDCVHVVYVQASTPASIRNSYRNYLTNPEDFVKLMREGLDRL
jgi:hypothetical protein